MTKEQMIVLCNEIARTTWYSFFFSTPYDSGNLARSIGDIGNRGLRINEVGFQLFDANHKAPYGAILNEAQTINYRARNNKTGQTYTGSYNNKHYRWVDKFFEQWVNEVQLYFPIRRVI